MKQDGPELGPGKEFDAIRRMVAAWGDTARGIGDDAAVLDIPRGDRLVTSVDACVEGVHFRREWLTPREVGYRAATAALSDLAAMAAWPLGLMFALTLPESWHQSLDEIAAGVGEAAEAAGTVILGGNISAGPALSITTTVLGHAYVPLMRSGARNGDRIYVTGALGGPGAAVSAWLAGRAPDPAHRARFAHPVARLREARILADHGARACIDVSDGLGADLAHLAAASGVSFTADVERIPCVTGVTTSEAARSGEEYELLIAAPKLDVAAVTAALGCALTEVGEVSADGRGLVLDGKPVVGGAGHDHLS